MMEPLDHGTHVIDWRLFRFYTDTRNNEQELGEGEMKMFFPLLLVPVKSCGYNLQFCGISAMISKKRGSSLNWRT